MSYAVAPDASRLTAEEFLDHETVAERTHEYVAGWIYASSGANRRHNILVSRLLQLLLNAADERWIELHDRDENGGWRQHRANDEEAPALPCLETLITPDELFDQLLD